MPLQLEEHIGRLREELDREREERNYFQLERDKVNSHFEILSLAMDREFNNMSVAFNHTLNFLTIFRFITVYSFSLMYKFKHPN